MYTTILGVTTFLAVLTVIAQVFIVITLLAYAFKWKQWTNFFEKHAIKIALAISTFTILGPMFFSEIANMPPCKLCWYQRIFIFPVFLILLTTVISKDYKSAPKFILPLNVIGALISLYHYVQQIIRTINPESDLITDCAIVGMTPSCSEFYILKFGYITIPNMALTAGISFILLMIMQIRYNKTQS